MTRPYIDFIRDPLVRTALKKAWEDSNPGPEGGHEEGGFFVRDKTGRLNVVRWPGGEQNTIHVPPHWECKIDGEIIIASFHTHPNTGKSFIQEPSETDKRAVRDDPDLKGDEFIGEFVISQDMIYIILSNGQVHEVDNTSTVVQEP